MSREFSTIVLLVASVFPFGAVADIPTVQWERCPIPEEAVWCEIARDGSFDDCPACLALAAAKTPAQ